MKKRATKLTLSRETLSNLDDSGVKAWGGFLPVQSGKVCPTIDDTRQISICVYCTTPLDSCPGTGTAA